MHFPFLKLGDKYSRPFSHHSAVVQMCCRKPKYSVQCLWPTAHRVQFGYVLRGLQLSFWTLQIDVMIQLLFQTMSCLVLFLDYTAEEISENHRQLASSNRDANCYIFNSLGGSLYLQPDLISHLISTYNPYFRMCFKMWLKLRSRQLRLSVELQGITIQ